MLEEKLLRFAAPVLYEKMIEIFSVSHIHPYDIQATVSKKENGLTVFLKFSSDFSQSVSHHFSLEQVLHPDEEVEVFFKEGAKECKALLIADYFKMMNP